MTSTPGTGIFHDTAGREGHGVPRRGPNEGTIRKRKDGRWEARVLVTDPAGRRVRRSFLGRDRGTVRGKLDEALRADANGISTATEKLAIR